MTVVTTSWSDDGVGELKPWGRLMIQFLRRGCRMIVPGDSPFCGGGTENMTEWKLRSHEIVSLLFLFLSGQLLLLQW